MTISTTESTITDHEAAQIDRANVAGEPLFQAASANINPWSEAKVDSRNPQRGPMLIVSADSDHTSRGRSRTRPTKSRSAIRA